MISLAPLLAQGEAWFEAIRVMRMLHVSRRSREYVSASHTLCLSMSDDGGALWTQMLAPVVQSQSSLGFPDPCGKTGNSTVRTYWSHRALHHSRHDLLKDGRNGAPMRNAWPTG